MAVKYIKDLLDLPTQVNKGDFVLNLAAGVSEANAAAMLRMPWTELEPVATSKGAL